MAIKRKIREVGREEGRSVSANKPDWLETEVRSLAQRNKERRYQLLSKLYYHTGGIAECLVILNSIRTPRQKLSSVLVDVLHLEAEGLVIVQKQSKPADCFVGLTHKGVTAVEN